jgi:hypothetical protein
MNILEMIRTALRDESDAMHEEYACTLRGDHRGAADAHDARLRALERARDLMQQLPEQP